MNVRSAFTHLPPAVSYPLRRVAHDDSDPKMQHNTLNKYAYTASGGNLGMAGNLSGSGAGGGRKRGRD